MPLEDFKNIRKRAVDCKRFIREEDARVIEAGHKIWRSEMDEKKSGRGGKRKGAGRKVGSTKANTKIQLTVRLAPEIISFLRSESRPGLSQSKIIATAIAGYYNLPVGKQ
jgi:hypothetical protein